MKVSLELLAEKYWNQDITTVYRARLKGGAQVALILFLALPGCSLANSHIFMPVSVLEISKRG